MSLLSFIDRMVTATCPEGGRFVTPDETEHSAGVSASARRESSRAIAMKTTRAA
jgi:hypothetical protein